MPTSPLIPLVISWAESRGLASGDYRAQFVKLAEEFGELAAGIAKNNDQLVLDSIGDMLVVLIIFGLNFSSRVHLRPEDFLEACLAIAWDEIKDRQGRTENGVFIKESE